MNVHMGAKIKSLRLVASMTQEQLAGRLGVSAQAVSKWESGTNMPDVQLLPEISVIFGVTIDYLLSDHDQWEAPTDDHGVKELTFSTRIVTALAIAAIWTLATMLFVILWLANDTAIWRIFVWTLPITLIVLLVLNSVWNEGRKNRFIVSALVLSLILLLYLTFLERQPWQLFLIAAPALLIVYLSFHIKKRWRK